MAALDFVQKMLVERGQTLSEKELAEMHRFESFLKLIAEGKSEHVAYAEIYGKVVYQNPTER